MDFQVNLVQQIGNIFAFQGSASAMKTIQEVQGLQAFAFPVVAFNNKHAKSSSKESLGVKFEEGVYVKL